MLIAARNSFMVGGKPTAKSYVQDGLIAMWDGIENAGWGVHDHNATVWKDLVGNKDATLTAHGSFSNDALVCDGIGYAAVDGDQFQSTDILGVDIVFESDIAGVERIICTPGTNPGNNRGVLIYQYANSVSGMSATGGSSSGLLNGFRGFTAGLRAVNFQYSTTNMTEAYLNGVPQTLRYSSLTRIGTSIAFGGRVHNSPLPFSGRIKNIRIYSRALSAAEIAANYAIDKERFNLPEATA